MRTKVFRKSVILVAAVLLIFLFPATRILPSMLVMSWSNAVECREALTHTEDIHVDFPTGKVTTSQEWYPFMLTFDASDTFSRWIDQSVQLTILYNFGGF
ncbi:MAG: hypothetical protein JXO44_03170 [Clostridia bacterium]|nr:hypothetical protein [Clostridia bacterium]